MLDKCRMVLLMLFVAASIGWTSNPFYFSASGYEESVTIFQSDKSIEDLGALKCDAETCGSIHYLDFVFDEADYEGIYYTTDEDGYYLEVYFTTMELLRKALAQIFNWDVVNNLNYGTYRKLLIGSDIIFDEPTKNVATGEWTCDPSSKMEGALANVATVESNGETPFTIENFCSRGQGLFYGQSYQDVTGEAGVLAYGEVQVRNLNFKNVVMTVSKPENDGAEVNVGLLVDYGQLNVENVTVDGIAIDTKIALEDNGLYAVGTLCGNCSQITANNVGVRNLDMSIVVENGELSENGPSVNVGGLVGFAKSISLSNVEVEGPISYDCGSTEGGYANVGGLVGRLESSNIDLNLGVSGLKYKGSLHSNAFTANVGGLMGYISRSSRITLYSSLAENLEDKNLIEISSEKLNNVYAGGLFGVVENENAEINTSFVLGDFYTNGNADLYNEKSQGLYMGGIVGYSVGQIIANTYSIGNLAKGRTVAKDFAHIGFVAGSTSSDLRKNYHYSEDDFDLVEKHVADAEDWMSGDFGEGNFRNAPEGYVGSEVAYHSSSVSLSEGVENIYDFDFRFKVKNDDGVDEIVYNAIIPAELMKSDYFAYEMQFYGTASGRQHFPLNGDFEWNRKEGVNEGLPFFSSNGGLGVFRISVELPKNLADLVPWDEYGAKMVALGNKVWVWTYSDGDGRLNKGFVDAVNSLVGEGTVLSFYSDDFYPGATTLDAANIYRSDARYTFVNEGVIPVSYKIDFGLADGSLVDIEDGKPVVIDGVEYNVIFLSPKLSLYKIGDVSTMMPQFILKNEEETILCKPTSARAMCGDEICDMEETRWGESVYWKNVPVSFFVPFVGLSDVGSVTQLNVVYTRDYDDVGITQMHVISELNDAPLVVQPLATQYNDDGETQPYSMGKYYASKIYETNVQAVAFTDKFNFTIDYGYELKGMSSRIVQRRAERTTEFEDWSAFYYKNEENIEKATSSTIMDAADASISSDGTVFWSVDFDGNSFENTSLSNVLAASSWDAISARNNGDYKYEYYMILKPEVEPIEYNVTFNEVNKVCGDNCNDLIFNDTYLQLASSEDNTVGIKYGSMLPVAYSISGSVLQWCLGDEAGECNNPATALKLDETFVGEAFNRDLIGPENTLTLTYGQSGRFQYGNFGVRHETQQSGSYKIPIYTQNLYTTTVSPAWTSNDNEEDIFYLPGVDDIFSYEFEFNELSTSMYVSGYGNYNTLAPCDELDSKNYCQITFDPKTGKGVFRINPMKYLKVAGDNSIRLEPEVKERHYSFELVDNGDFAFEKLEDINFAGHDSLFKTPITLPGKLYKKGFVANSWNVVEEAGSGWKKTSEDLMEAAIHVTPTEIASRDETLDFKYRLYPVWEEDKETKYVTVRLANENVGKVFMVHLDAASLDQSVLISRDLTVDGVEIPLLDSKEDREFVVVFEGGMNRPANGTYIAIVDEKDTVKLSAANDFKMVLSGNTVIDVYEGEELEPDNPPEEDAMEFALSETKTSGLAFRYSFTTNSFNVEKKAFVRIELMDALGNMVMDSLIVEKIEETPLSYEFVGFVGRPGAYVLRAEMVSDETQEMVGDVQNLNVELGVADGLGGGADSWRMISLSQVDLDKVSWNKDDQVFYWWNEALPYGEFWQYQKLEEGASVVATAGYWYSSRSGEPLTLSDIGEKKYEFNDTYWNLDSVFTGWNMVANPYGWFVKLQDLKDVLDGSAGEVEYYRWNSESGSYEEAEIMGPYEAVWAKVGSPVDVAVPWEPVFVETESNENVNEDGAMRRKALAKARDNGNWALQLVLSDNNGRRDSWNVIGVSSAPFVSEEPPQGMGDHVELSILEGKKALTKSIKAASGELEWTVSMRASSQRYGYLSVEGVENIESYGLHVFVTIDGVTTEVKSGSPIKVLLKSTELQAVVRVAPNAKTVVKNGLDQLHMTQHGGLMNVDFVVDETLAKSPFVVEMVSIKGQILASCRGKTLAGHNSVTLKAPKSGLYVVRVRVAGNKTISSFFSL